MIAVLYYAIQMFFVKFIRAMVLSIGILVICTRILVSNIQALKIFPGL